MAYHGNKGLIELYCSMGGIIHVSNVNGWNALHYSASNDRFETTKYLVSIGIDYKAKNSESKTPLDLAKQQYKKSELVKFLEQVEMK